MAAFGVQTLRVRLDENGAEIKSRMMMLRSGSPGEPRRMHLDGPCLIAFVEDSAPLPYRMLWIANPELLVPRPASQQLAGDGCR